MGGLVEPEPEARPGTEQDGNRRPCAEEKRELEDEHARDRADEERAGRTAPSELTSARATEPVSSARAPRDRSRQRPGRREAGRQAEPGSELPHARALPLDVDQGEPVELPDELQHVRARLLGGERERLGQLAHDRTDRGSGAREHERSARVERPRVSPDGVGQPPVPARRPERALWSRSRRSSADRPETDAEGGQAAARGKARDEDDDERIRHAERDEPRRRQPRHE